LELIELIDVSKTKTILILLGVASIPLFFGVGYMMYFIIIPSLILDPENAESVLYEKSLEIQSTNIFLEKYPESTYKVDYFFPDDSPNIIFESKDENHYIQYYLVWDDFLIGIQHKGIICNPYPLSERTVIENDNVHDYLKNEDCFK